VCAAKAPKREWAFDTQGGYTPWDFVHFTNQWNKHKHTVRPCVAERGLGFESLERREP
jgi:hypothetical protein